MTATTLQRLDARSQSVHNLVNAVAVPMAVHAGGPIIAANEAFCRLVSRSSDVLSELEVSELVVDCDREAVVDICRICLDGSGLPPVTSCVLLTPDGGERPVEMHARPVNLGGTPAVVLTCVDQSDILHLLA